MCILFVYTNPKPHDSNSYRLIIASNRDEDYYRPAKSAFKCPTTNIIGGRDMTEGRENGMWLGMLTDRNHLKFAALLNVPNTNSSTASDNGRGPIVYNYLTNLKTTPQDYIENDLKKNLYNSYNCIMIDLIGDQIDTQFHSNSPETSVKYEADGEQFLGFGNCTAVAPLKKVNNGIEMFKNIIKTSTDRDELKTRLIYDLLKSKQRHFPDPILVKNLPSHFEDLSSIFVQVPNRYGTRAHTLILVDYEGNVEFVEHSLKDHGQSEWEDKQFKAHL